MSSRTSKYCICKDAEKSRYWIGCDSNLQTCPGNGWYHQICVGLTPKQAEELVYFVCPACEAQDHQDSDSSSNSTDTQNKNTTDERSSTIISNLTDTQDENTADGSSSSSTIIYDANTASGNGSSTDQSDTDLEADEFDVQSIIGVGWTSTGARKFKVHWKGHNSESDHTWEFEYRLWRCHDLIKKYCEENKLSPTRIKPIGGADILANKGFNQENWTTVEIVIQRINHYVNMETYRSNLKVCNQVPDGEEDYILVSLIQSHFVITLVNRKEGLAFVADGTNIAGRNRQIYDTISRAVGSKLIFIKFGQQRGIDHCGSSAVMIALELIRLYKNGCLPVKELRVPPGKLKRVARELHPRPSEPLERSHTIARVPRLVCDKCKVYKLQPGADRRKLLMHMRSCQKK